MNSTNKNLSKAERLGSLNWVLTDLILDLSTNVKVFHDYFSNDDFNGSATKRAAISRMICGSLTVNLFKLHEALQLYGKEINELSPPLRNQCNELRKEIQKRRICDLRSKYVAHVEDKKTKKPINLNDGEQLVKEIFGEALSDLSSFCDWVWQDVLSVVVSLREYCRENGSRER
ncbi:MAG: integron-associated HEPN domain-containing protein [Marinomonas sp.]|mgnify:CR=1 FL=1